MFNSNVGLVYMALIGLKAVEEHWRRVVEIKRLKDSIYPPPPLKNFLEEYVAISQQEKESLLQFAEIIEDFGKAFNQSAVVGRVSKFRFLLNAPMTEQTYISELQFFRETAEEATKAILCYCYTPEKSAELLQFKEEWGSVLDKFPSASADSFAAVDCWALGHATASVFHSMRVAEIGLRALARERRVKLPKKPLEWANWEDILRQIRKKVEEIGNRRAGPARGAALEFYRGALGEFEAFKDAYRNNVMHVRSTYDEHQARSVLLHVHEFMRRLAAKTGENEKKQIAWGKM